MKAKGLVLEPRKYMGTVTPPLSLEDASRFGNNGTFHGNVGTPTWMRRPTGLWVVDFNAADLQFIDFPAAIAEFNFTAGDFSMAIWLLVTSYHVAHLMTRGLAATDGWYFGMVNRRIRFGTCQAGAGQESLSIDDFLNTAYWRLVAATRSGSSVRLFGNGVDITDVVGVHIDPVTANRELHIGIADDEVSLPFDGMMWNPRIYNYALSPTAIAKHFEAERRFFGV